MSTKKGGAPKGNRNAAGGHHIGTGRPFVQVTRLASGDLQAIPSHKDFNLVKEGYIKAMLANKPGKYYS